MHHTDATPHFVWFNVVNFQTKDNILRCRRCSSDNKRTFSTEMNIHFPGREGFEKPTVLVFSQVSICLNCGLADFKVPDRELRALADGLSGKKAESA